MSVRILEHRFLNIPLSAVAISLGLHLAILAFVFVAPALEKLGIFPKHKALDQVYQSFIQVDVVALPDQILNQKSTLDTSLPVVDKPAQTKPEEHAEQKKEDVMLFQQAQKEEEAKKAAAAKKHAEEEAAKQKQIAEKKRQAEQEKALKKIKEEARREAALKALESKAGKQGRGKIAGNVLSKGSSLTGAIGTAKDQYAGRVVEAIRQNFNIYFWQQKKGLAAVVNLELFPNGKVKSRKIIKKSIDSTYDSAVLQAVDSATFPAPEDPSILNEDFNITITP